MKAYKGFNVITNKPVGYFTKEEAEAMTKNPAYKSISFIKENSENEKEKKDAKARKQSEQEQADAEQAQEPVVNDQPKKKAAKEKE